MALSFQAVEKAYQVFATLKKSGVAPNLSISSFPEDMATWTDEEKKQPREFQVYGFDKKRDGGWENIFFFAKNPSVELLQKFDELKDQVPNSSMSGFYSGNDSLWVIGWF
jgi:hypothetical protein